MKKTFLLQRICKSVLCLILVFATFQMASAQGTGNPTFVNPGGTNTINVTPYFTGSDPDGIVTHIRVTAFPTYTTSVIIGGVFYTSATFPAAGIIFPVGTTVLFDPVDGTNSIVTPYKVIDNAGFESLNTANLIIALTEAVTPDLTLSMDIDNLSFPIAGVPRDFVINVFEINGGTAGNPITVRLSKLTAYTISYPTASGTSNVYGGIANENSNWDFTENASFVTATAKPGVNISANGAAVLGFTITRKAGVTNGTVQSLTATITGGSGGETNVSNNKAITSLSAPAN